MNEADSALQTFSRILSLPFRERTREPKTLSCIGFAPELASVQ